MFDVSSLLKYVPDGIKSAINQVASVAQEATAAPASAEIPAAVPASEPAVASVETNVLTKQQLSAACPALIGTRLDDTLTNLNIMLPKYAITTGLEIAAFLATCGCESADFTTFSENLNYSAEALQIAFKQYFPNATLAAQYARNPQAIGSRAYANRMGNGNEASREGYLYRGAGAIQITGKKNIGTFALAMNMPIDQAVSYMRTLPGGIESACWFWNVNHLNDYVDDFQSLQGLVNTGRANATASQINGWSDRLSRFNRARKALGV
jgi:putative chitinase